MSGQQALSYTCPNCDGPLHFDPATGNMKCDYCDSIFTVAEAKKYYEAKLKKEEDKAREKAEKDKARKEKEQAAQSAQAPFQENAGQAGAGSQTQAQSSSEENGWGEHAEHMRTYTCTSCGAALVCDETTAATTCPYCGNPTVMASTFAATKPEFVVPFKSDKKKALEKLKGYYAGRKLIPNSFVDNNHLEEIQGVYVPFWLYNGSVDCDMSFNCENSTTTRQGDYNIIRTKHYKVRRAGNIPFANIPVDASTKMDDALMDSVEPFDYNELKTFEYEYLPGYVANQYDVKASDCRERARERAVNTAVSAIRGTVTGYGSVSEISENRQVRLHSGKTTYALMPVWMLHTKWNDQDFMFAMNGQTERMTGNLPVDRNKAILYFLLISLISGLITTGLSYLFMGPEDYMFVVVGILLGLAIGGVGIGAMIGSMKPVRVAKSAETYMTQKGGVNLSVKEDHFINETTQRVRVQQAPPPGNPGPQGPGSHPMNHKR